MKFLRTTTALLSCLALAACPGDDEEDTGADTNPTPTSTGTSTSTSTDSMTPPGTQTTEPGTSTGDPGTSTGMADSGSTSNLTATDTEDCLTCAQVQNEMGDPALLCEGEAFDAFNAVAGCICGNCPEECAATACGMPPMVPDMACLDCFVPLCMEEIGACNEA